MKIWLASKGTDRG